MNNKVLLSLVVFVCVLLLVPINASLWDMIKCLCEDQPIKSLPLSGGVDDCCCTIDTVHNVNEKLLPVIDSLVKKAFFKYYKVDLDKKCEFFPEDGQCFLRTCAVEDCDWEEIKREFKEEPIFETQVENPLGYIDTKIDTKIFTPWKEQDNPWSSNHNNNERYFDLSKNPERFTGYAGVGANRIWSSIYNENCFSNARESDPTAPHVCIEKRVFYRLFSGLHTSISCHLTYDYLCEGSTWGPNVTLFYDKVGNHPARIKNLYFLYLFVFRSISKLTPYLQQYNYNTKTEHENKEIKDLMAKFEEISLSCPETFDESTMFQNKESLQLKKEYKHHFRNISRILDCVVCEKCKLWGKVQVNGLGTALKVLFELYSSDSMNKISEIDSSITPEFEKKISISDDVDLQRTDIIALINFFHKLSESIEIIKKMQNQETYHQHQPQVMVLSNFTIISNLILYILIVTLIYKKIVRRKVVDPCSEEQL